MSQLLRYGSTTRNRGRKFQFGKPAFLALSAGFGACEAVSTAFLGEAVSTSLRIAVENKNAPVRKNRAHAFEGSHSFARLNTYYNSGEMVTDTKLRRELLAR
jgi:hypothetical protein